MQGAASRTAMSTALMRAAHTRLDPQPLIEDAWGEALVPPHVREQLQRDMLERLAREHGESGAPDGEELYRMLMRSPPFANVIMRSRYTEDTLARAVANGVRQYVLIGAGFDSFILRRPAFARDLAVFEIDHPATLAAKLERLRELAIEPAPPVHFIASDLAQEGLCQALSRSPYSAGQRSFFSWLGVTMYLSREANLATFAAIARCAPPGSEVAFTYLEQQAFDAPTMRFQAIQQRLSALGEPFVSGFDPPSLAAQLAEIGLELTDDVNGAAAAARYDPAGTHGFERNSVSHLALAQVVSRRPA